jgi:hypothetical protein
MSPQFDFTEDRPTASRPKTPKKRPVTPGALPAIEEKDGEVEVRVRSIAEPSSSNSSPTELSGADGKEMFMTTSSNGERAPERGVVLDKFGFPLLPQPLDDPRDPLTWSKAVKIRILIQISLLSSLSLFTAYAIVSFNVSIHNVRDR